MYLGFDFLRAGSAPKWLIVLVAIVWGVGGVAALYWILNWIVERMNLKWRGRLQPLFCRPGYRHVDVVPGRACSANLLAEPVQSGWSADWLAELERYRWQLCLIERALRRLDNYVAVFTDRLMREAFRNNIMWIVFGATLTVIVAC